MMTVDVDKRETRLCLVPPSVPRGVLALISCHASRVTSSKYFQLHKINARKRKKQLLFYLQRWPQLTNQTQGASTVLTFQNLTFKFVTRSSFLRERTAVQASQMTIWHPPSTTFNIKSFLNSWTEVLQKSSLSPIKSLFTTSATAPPRPEQLKRNSWSGIESERVAGAGPSSVVGAAGWWTLCKSFPVAGPGEDLAQTLGWEDCCYWL